MSWSKAKLTLAQQATKAAKVLLHFVRKSDASCQQALFLFDSMISPILCYNSEIWGYECCDDIERVHVKFCKNILRLNSSATTPAVLGEVGRLPLCTLYMNKCVKYFIFGNKIF
jgi:hypothetical protein